MSKTRITKSGLIMGLCLLASFAASRQVEARGYVSFGVTSYDNDFYEDSYRRPWGWPHRHWGPPSFYEPPPVVYLPPPPPPPIMYVPAPVYQPAPQPEPAPAYQAQQGQYCREYQSTVTVGGQPQLSTGTACLQPDGHWRIMN